MHSCKMCHIEDLHNHHYNNLRHLDIDIFLTQKGADGSFPQLLEPGEALPSISLAAATSICLTDPAEQRPNVFTS